MKAYSNLNSYEKEKLSELKTPIHETFIKFIDKYNKLKSKLSEKEADINNCKNILQLYQVIKNNIKKDYSNSAIKKEGKVDILVNNYEWLIFTPYDFEVSKTYGHNNVKKGKNWCTCYDESHFIENFGPIGGLTYIINKLDETKDLALKKDKDGTIEVWNYNDEHIFTYYVNRPKDFIYFLQKNTDGNEFLIDYFKNNPITEDDLPDVDFDTLRDKWVEANMNNIEDYLHEYEYIEYVDWELFEKELYNRFLYANELDEATDDMINYIKKYANHEKEKIKEGISSSELIKILKNNGLWKDFITNWFDNNIRGNKDELEKYFNKLSTYDALEFIDVYSYMYDVSMNIDSSTLFQYYDY